MRKCTVTLKRCATPRATDESRGWTCCRGRDRCREVMKANPDKVEQYRSGKTKLGGFFVGQAVTRSGGKADPEITQEVSRRLLDEEVNLVAVGASESPGSP